MLVNSGNVRPHVYTLDYIRELWSKGPTDSEVHLRQFVRRMYSACEDEIAAFHLDYAEQTISYGPNEDDRAGEEFYHHPAREIVGHWLQGRDGHPLHRLNWASGPVSFAEQVEWFRRKCADALPGCEGFAALGDSFNAYLNKDFPVAFVHASRAMWSYQQGIDVLKEAEHGDWQNFYRADWLTNIKSTVNNMDTLRRWLRMHGDNPDFFAWYKNFLMPETDKCIYLENTHRNPLTDDELAQRLQIKFGISYLRNERIH